MLPLTRLATVYGSLASLTELELLAALPRSIAISASTFLVPEFTSISWPECRLQRVSFDAHDAEILSIDRRVVVVGREVTSRRRPHSGSKY